MALARRTHWAIQETIAWTGSVIGFAALGYIFFGRAYVSPPPSAKVSLRELLAQERAAGGGDAAASSTQRSMQ